jgi:5,10-methylenetetrahydromethanopterin reductase
MENRRLDAVPNGAAWAAAYADVPANARHLALHDRHLIAMNDRDRRFVTGEMLAQNGLALDAAGWRERVALLQSMGATEIAYQPAGPDVPGELERFANAVRG